MPEKKIDFKLSIIIFLSLLILTFVGIVAAHSNYALNNLIYPGVQVLALDLGGLTKEQAKFKLEQEIAKKKQEPLLDFAYTKQNWAIKDTDIAWKINTAQLLEQAYQIGRQGNILEKLKEQFLSYHQGKELTFNCQYDQNKLQDKIKEIAEFLDCEPQDAYLELQGKQVKKFPDKNGVKVKQEEAYLLAKQVLEKNLPARLDLPVEEQKAAITKEDLANITDLLSSFSSYFNPYLYDRAYNVTLAAKYMDFALVKPGEIYSFNKGIGPRNIEMGYRDAPTYLGEEIVPGIGGGICQVSSTLYLAALHANLEIVERENHIRPVGYVPLGQDATIAGDFIDLKFKNTTAENLYIRSFIEDESRVRVQIFGKKPANFPQVEIISDNIQVFDYKKEEEQDGSLKPGERKVEREGEKGYKVTTYRLKYLNGQLIETERLYNDYYPVINELIKVGPVKAKEEKPLIEDEEKKENSTV